MPSNELLTLDDVSEMTGVPKNTLKFWRATNSGGPRTFKVGNRIRAKREDVEAWIAAQYAATSVGGAA